MIIENQTNTLDPKAARPKMACRLMSRDGAKHRMLRLFPDTKIGAALPGICDLLGLQPEPPSFTRYALEAGAAGSDGMPESFIQLRDDEVFGDLAPESFVRVTCQPSPAADSG